MVIHKDKSSLAGQTVKIDDPRAIFIFNGNAVAINIDIDEGEG